MEDRLRQDGSKSCQPNVGFAERLISIAGGIGLLLVTHRRSSWWTLPLALGGGMLVERGIAGYCPVYQALGVDRRRDALQPEGPASPGQRPPRDRVTEASEESFPASDPPSW